MTPVKQTKFGKPDGNCFASYIASVLEVPLEEVPHIFGPGEEARWDELDRYLSSRGYAYVEFPFLDLQMCVFTDKIHAILVGPAARGLPHSIVAVSENQSWVYVHDPHPSDDFLCDDPTHIGFLVKR